MNFSRPHSEESAGRFQPKNTNNERNSLRTSSPIGLRKIITKDRLEQSFDNYTNETLPVFRNIGPNNARILDSYDREKSNSPGPLSRRL